MDNSGNGSGILIVDDDILIAESNKILLKREGYGIAGIACDGRTAIDSAIEKNPDLVLMDINLNSEIDGITAAEEIQKVADVPIIFLTAYSDPATIDRAKRVGPFGYLIKPFEKRELLVAIETTLYKHQFEKKLKEQELLFRTVANFAYEWEFWLLPNLQFKFCSPSCKRISGYENFEFMNNPKLLSDIIHPEDREKFEQHMTDYSVDKINETVTSFEFRIINKQGGIKYLRHTCTPIYDDKNNYLGRRVTNVDITDRILSEEKLKESEERYRLLMENSLDAILLTQPDGKIFSANPAACRMFRRTEEEICSIGRNGVLDTSDPRLQKSLEERVRTGKFKGELTMLRKNGEKFQGEITTSIYSDMNGHQKTSMIIRDITERKHAEMLLRESEEKFRRLFDDHSAIKLLIDPKTGNIVEANQAAANFYGWSKKEFKKMCIQQLGTVNSDKIFEQIQIINSLEQSHNEFPTKLKDGSIRFIEVFTSKTKIAGKSYLHSIVHDITDRKKAERELQRFFDLVPNMVCVTTSNGIFERLNKAWESTLGFTVDEMISKPFLEFIHPDDKNATYAEAQKHLAGQQIINFVNRYRTKSGEYKLLEWVASPSPDGKKLYAAARDITEKVEKDNELKRYRDHLEELVELRTQELNKVNADLNEQLRKEKELEMMLRKSLGKEKELNELKTRFISTASHEFRTPMTSVLTSAELIQHYGKKWDEEKVNKYIGRIKRSVDYVISLLNEVLIISRVESGSTTFEPDYIDLESFCREIVSELKPTLGSNQKFIFNYETVEKIFKLDSKLLKFILNNLLSNAIKYSSVNGEVKLSVTENENNLIFEVIDDGIGIPEEDQKNLFEPFFRGTNVIEIPGTGLGLSIVKQSVELHKGQIGLKSKLGKGTTFTVKFLKDLIK